MNPRITRRALPAAISVGLHALALAGLYIGFHPSAPASPAPKVMRTALVSLPSPAPIAPAPPPVVQPPEPVPPPPPQVEAPRPTPQPDVAQLARRKAEQREREERQREVRRQEQQRIAEQQRQEQEQRSRQQAEKRARAEHDRQLAAQQAAAAEAARAAQNYQPLVKKAPTYPDSALDRRLEGDCTVEYTVAPNGSVRDPRVVPGACSHSVFERPSLQAATRFRYQPRVIDGQAVAVANVRNTFHYRIQETSR